MQTSKTAVKELLASVLWYVTQTILQMSETVLANSLADRFDTETRGEAHTPNYFRRDTVAFMMPLLDRYAAPAWSANLQNVRVCPSNAQLATRPKYTMLVVVGINILMQEKPKFVKRVKDESGESGAKERSVEAV